MKNLLLTILISAGLFSCKKEEFSVYKISNIQRPGTYACKYTARCPGKPEVTFFDECGKFKVGQTIKIGL